MIFTEPRFFVFFAVVFGVYWWLESNRARKMLLLAASYVFYGAWDYRFLALIWLSTTLDYALGRVLGNPETRHPRRWVVTSVVVNLTILGFFKYFGFFTESFADLASTLGFKVRPWVLDIVLPAGISFYTFQSLSYTIDVYRGHKPARSWLDFATFVAFFPQLVAGPIVRASDFLPQLDERRSFADVDVKAALVAFLIGFIKKAVIADNLAPIVDQYFSDPSAYDAASAWIAALFYSVQIYCDFSGYTDMAIASASLLGYQLVKNFDFPYFSSNVTTFWRRWHMSLSTWLRDYLYVPLGGNRGGTLLTYRNLMFTMLLGGLWHGAAWHFVVWGALHGAALSVERALGVRAEPAGGAAMPGNLLGVVTRGLMILGTFYFTCVAWIVFRAASLPDALAVLRSFVFLHSPGEKGFPPGLFVVFGALVLVHAAFRRLGSAEWWRRVPRFGFAVGYGVLFALAVTFVPLDERPFIYFQF